MLAKSDHDGRARAVTLSPTQMPRADHRPDAFSESENTSGAIKKSERGGEIEQYGLTVRAWALDLEVAAREAGGLVEESPVVDFEAQHEGSEIVCGLVEYRSRQESELLEDEKPDEWERKLVAHSVDGRV